MKKWCLAVFLLLAGCGVFAGTPVLEFLTVRIKDGRVTWENMESATVLSMEEKIAGDVFCLDFTRHFVLWKNPDVLCQTHIPANCKALRIAGFLFHVPPPDGKTSQIRFYTLLEIAPPWYSFNPWERHSLAVMSVQSQKEEQTVLSGEWIYRAEDRNGCRDEFRKFSVAFSPDSRDAGLIQPDSPDFGFAVRDGNVFFRYHCRLRRYKGFCEGELPLFPLKNPPGEEFR